MRRSIDSWFPHDIAALAAESAHMTAEEYRAYIHLLEAAWPREGVLPDNPAWLIRMAHSTAKRWAIIGAIVLEPFQRVDLDLIHERLRAVRLHAQAVSDAKRDSGSKGGRPRNQTVRERLTDGNQMKTHARVIVPVSVRGEGADRLEEPTRKEEKNLSGGTTRVGASIIRLGDKA